MKNKLDDKLDDLDKCIFAGKEVKHYTDYKPNCKECKGYRMICEQKGIYEPKSFTIENVRYIFPARLGHG